MRHLREIRPKAAAGASLTPSPPANIELPLDYRGSILRGVEAAARASSVSGPFEASPSAYVVPDDEASLGLVLAWAWSSGIPVIPRGAGTGMPGGNLGAGLVVEVGASFGGVEVIDQESRRLRVGAGEIASEVDRAAHELGGFLPFLPSSAPWCRVGGMIANNAAGARSFRYGSISGWVDALEGFYPWGERFRVAVGETPPNRFSQLRSALMAKLEVSAGGVPSGWPSVRKNSSGYALDRFLPEGEPTELLVGSEGTLAVITHAELRFAPLPAERGWAVVPLDSAQALEELALESAELGATACEFLGRRFLELVGPELESPLRTLAKGAFALALVEVSGSDPEVRAGLEGISRFRPVRSPGFVTRDSEVGRRVWAIRHAASPIIAREAARGRISTQFIEDCVVPPRRLAAYLDGLDRILRSLDLDAVVFGHAGDANVHVNPLIDVTRNDWQQPVRRALDEVTQLVGTLGGTLSGEHGDGRLRAPMLDRIWSTPLAEGFREAKQAFDPRQLLNPGVIVPLPSQDPLEGFLPRPRSHPDPGQM